MARLPDRDPRADPQAAAVLEELAGSRGYVSNLLRSMLHSPEGLRRWAQVGDWARYRTRLDARLRELAILTVGRALPYVMGHHVPLGLQAGLSQAAIDEIRAGRVPGDVPAREQAAVRYVLELTSPDSVSDATFKALQGHLDEGEISDLTIVSVYYLAAGTLCRAFKVELDSPEAIQGAAAWQQKKDAR